MSNTQKNNETLKADNQKAEETMSARKARAQSPKAVTGDIAKAVPLNDLFGVGDTVRIGGKEYELAAFPIARLSDASALLNRIPTVLLAHALAYTPADGYDIDRTTAMAKMLQPSLEADFTEAGVSAQLKMNPIFTDGYLSPMVDFCVLALRRRNEITPETLSEHLDMTELMHLVRVTLARNPGLKDRF